MPGLRRRPHTHPSQIQQKVSFPLLHNIQPLSPCAQRRTVQCRRMNNIPKRFRTKPKHLNRERSIGQFDNYLPRGRFASSIRMNRECLPYITFEEFLKGITIISILGHQNTMLCATECIAFHPPLRFYYSGLPPPNAFPLPSIT